jgi:hypothetical protein
VAGRREGVDNRGVKASPSGRGGAGSSTTILGLLLGGWMLLPAHGLASEPVAAAPDELPDSVMDTMLDPDAGVDDRDQPETPTGEAGTTTGLDWIEDQRAAVARRLGSLVDAFDRFFGDERQLDVESPSTRLRLRSFVTAAEDRDVASGVAAAVSVRLPRLQRWLGNARLVLATDEAAATPGASPPGGGSVPIAPPAPPARTAEAIPGTRGRADLRFDLLRQDSLVLDTGIGFTFTWPVVPYARVRGHLRLGLGAGLVLRATQNLFVELWGRGPGTTTDLVVDRFFGATVRLRWEGHGLYFRTTRGIEWNSLVAAEWRVHPRTGLGVGVGGNGFGTPEPALDVWRTWVSARQDLWGGWVFAELEPELAWPRLAGQPRGQVMAVTLRLEVVIDGRPSPR